MEYRDALKRQEVRVIAVVAFCLGLLVGGFSVWLTTQPSQQQEKVAQSSESSATDEAQTTEESAPQTVRDRFVLGARVQADDQPAGDRVVVSHLELPPEGAWVVVHEVGPNATFLNALGAQRYDAGVTEGEVSLLRNTQPGHQYAVVLYQDNGDRKFSLEDDRPFLDAQTGEPIFDLFTATAPAGAQE